MAKKSENELRNVLKTRDRRSQNFSMDIGRGESRTSGVMFDMGSKKIIEELSSFKAPTAKIAKTPTDNVSKKKFYACFEGDKYPQNDEIESVWFMPFKSGSGIYLRMVITPKRKTYFKELLFNNDFGQRFFTITFYNEMDEVVESEKFILEKMPQFLVYPFQFNHNGDNNSFIFDDDLNIKYTVDFRVINVSEINTKES